MNYDELSASRAVYNVFHWSQFIISCAELRRDFL